MNRPSLGRLLFAPEFGRSVRPLRQNFGMFVGLVAGLLAQAGLLSREMDGPVGAGLRGEGRLRLMEVLGAAYKNVRWTKEGLPQAVFFMAVAGMLLFGVLSILTIILLVISGPAVAADNPFAALPAATPGGLAGASDLAPRWLNYLVQGNVPLDEFGLNPGPVQAGLRALLGFYSHGMLILGSLLLLYLLMAMALETAQQGNFLGQRSSSLWTPIRLVFAIGLLVPLNGQLNAGQYLVLEVAKVGSNFASNAWKLVAHRMLNFTPRVPVVPTVNRLVRGMVHIGYCMEASRILNSRGDGDFLDVVAVTLPSGDAIDLDTSMAALSNVLSSVQPGNTVKFGLRAAPDSPRAGEMALSAMCGQITLPANASYAVHIRTAFRTFADLGVKLAEITVPGGSRFRADDEAGRLEEMQRLKERYITGIETVNTSIAGAAQSVAARYKDAGVPLQLQMDSNLGWMLSGLFFNNAARLQSALFTELRDLGQVIWPSVSAVRQHENTRYNVLLRGRYIVEAWVLYGEIDHTAALNEAILNDTGNSYGQDMMAYAVSAGLMESGIYGDGDGDGFVEPTFLKMPMLITGFTPGHWVETGRSFENDAACPVGPRGGPGESGARGGLALSRNCMGSTRIERVWVEESATLQEAQLIQEADPNNALLELSLLGHRKLQWGLGNWTAALFWGAIPGIGPIVSFLFVLLGTVGFTAGLILAFYLPILPFIRIMFGTLTWLLNILEAMIAVPVVALAHMNREGEGLIPQPAKQGYYYVLQIFVRPILMVIGLLVALLLMNTMMGFVNFGFALAFVASHTYNGTEELTNVMFLLIYALLGFNCVNLSTKMIDIIPDNSLRWLGASSKSYGFDGGETVERVVEAAGVFGNRAASQMSSAVGNAGNQGMLSLTEPFRKKQ